MFGMIATERPSVNCSPIVQASQCTVDLINRLEPKYLTTLKQQSTRNCEREKLCVWGGGTFNNIDAKGSCPFDKSHYAEKTKDLIGRK